MSTPPEMIKLMCEVRDHIGGAEQELRSLHQHIGVSTNSIELELRAALRKLIEITEYYAAQRSQS